MRAEDLLIYKSDTFSQNGEDGIIAAIFERIGTTTRICCEFGAWDGIHLSNCRSLIVQGWSALMIEGDEVRYRDLISNYATNPLVTSANKYIDAGSNRLGSIIQAHKIGELDFLSIDIDGLDYEIFETLDVRPRVICIEVNAGHDPGVKARLPRNVALNNVGQPLKAFVQIAETKGYELACYTGNAFFVRRDVVKRSSLPILSSKEAYQNFLNALDVAAREWLYLVNLGIVEPNFRFHNPYLTRRSLKIGLLRARQLRTSPP
jgi:hypothetical protein